MDTSEEILFFDAAHGLKGGFHSLAHVHDSKCFIQFLTNFIG